MAVYTGSLYEARFIAEFLHIQNDRNFLAIKTGQGHVYMQAASTAGGQSSALELTVSMTSSAGGAASVQKATFLSSTDLSNDALFKMAAPAAAAMTQQHESNMQLQQMSGQVCICPLFVACECQYQQFCGRSCLHPSPRR